MQNWEKPVMLAFNTTSNKTNLPSYILLIIIFILCPVVMSQILVVPDSDTDCLLKFKATLSNGSILRSWNPETSPCIGNTPNWSGVFCTNYVWGIQLERMGLTGKLNLEPLVSMKHLRTISFMNNELDGPMPEVKRLTGLRSLYLSNNRFSGEIPADAFQDMAHLKKIYLANNDFKGQIPFSLTFLPMLLELRLNGNHFEGNIPNFKQEDIKIASFENNDLDGSIPSSLKHLDPGSFAGNQALCDPPLSPCFTSSQEIPDAPPTSSMDPKSPPSPPSHPTPPSHKDTHTGNFYTIMIILIVIGIILTIIACLICFLRPRRRNRFSAYASEGKETIESYNYHHQQPVDNPATIAVKRKSMSDPNMLFFVRDDIERFNLQDLLRGSAEVLGSGTFGASYKATIASGETLVVKRHKHMNNVGREEFHEHMRRLGRLNHRNLLPLVAYYYRREEKLLVTRFMHNSSLANHLHANRSVDHPSLDWITRLKIIKGVANALSYLFDKLPTLTIPHGNIKSSNVVLDDSFEPLLTDYALRPVITSDQAHHFMTAYNSPEYRASQGHVITKKTDVWCLGVLILELLTGRFPENYLTQGYDPNMSLVTWVSDMVKEKKTGDVFEKEMKGKKNCKAEMINLLKIGLRCCEEEEERRITMSEALDMIEVLKDGDSDDDFGSLDQRRSHLYSTMLLDDDDGFSVNR